MSSDLTISEAVSNVQETSIQRQQLTEDFDDFLSLLTIQLQNQDPLSPMDSTEFTNQLVNFAGVEQQINANEKLNELVNFGLVNMNTQVLGYVGLQANYQSTELYYDGARPVDISYVVDGTAVSADIRIVDESGETVALIPGETGAGRKDFTWDGIMDNGQAAESGTYEVRVDAVDSNGGLLDSQILVSGIVRGVETQDGQAYLLIGERAVPVGNVINVYQPEPLSTADGTDTTDTEEGEGGSA